MKNIRWQIITIIIVSLFLGFFDLPGSIQSKILPFTPEWIKNTKINLGLDLQGGSQLDYKIDLRKVPEKDQNSIVEGVKEVIQKRVNRLGVAEPNIYRSDVAGEAHIVVELAETAPIEQVDVKQYLGVEKDVQTLNDDERKTITLEKAKDTVGKTIQLEFKEQKTELDPQEKDKIKEEAESALDKIKKGGKFEVIAQEEEQAYPDKVSYEKPANYVFSSDLPTGIKEVIPTLKIGEITQNLVETGGQFSIDAQGSAVENKALSIIKLIDVKEEVKNKKETSVSHILISWKGLETADANTTRTKDEAYKLAKEIKEKLAKGEKFEDLAKQYSSDASNKDTGGKLEQPVTGDGTYVYDFETASQKLKEGEVSDPVETKFGYHIIKADKVQNDVKEKQYKYESLSYSTVPNQWKDTNLNGEHFLHANVAYDNLFQPYIEIQFDEQGAKLFEELTGKNIGKPLAIFVGGELISAPQVKNKISGGSAQITGNFTQDEAEKLARDLNTGAIPAPIVLTNEYTIGATLGQEALSKSLKAGVIGVIFVMLFMILYYRLPGVLASFALIVYGTILLFLIKAQLPLGLALLIALIIFGYLVYKIINNKDLGWEKFLSFVLACIGFFFVTFLLRSGVVLTLAGITGIILSIGMAVDANILIFERMKEELKSGRSLKNAIEEGFARAWSAIRDSNFSTLLTCAILFYFGSSIIRGFAFNLAAGVVVSMFTAITITRTLLLAVANKTFAQKLSLYGVNDKKPFSFDFIKRTKLWFTISAVVVGISLLSVVFFGFNLGLDFKGGTLMEFKFDKPIAKEEIVKALGEVQEDLNKTEKQNISQSTVDETQIGQVEETTPDLKTSQVVSAGENTYLIKTKYINSQTHDKVIAKLEQKLPKFTESRFTTIGPTIGKNLLNKAIFATIIASLMIVIYVAFAFRRIPKEVSPWKFGLSAIIALIHDVIITTGIFIILGKFLGAELDALFITAMLTVLGYSVNDSIVVLDRMRENLIHGSGESFEKNANRSLNETMARSLNTTLSTILTLIAILIFGSGSIFYFVLALTLGISIGAYSSIFVATPLLAYWSRKR